MNEQRFVVVDLETTGNSPKKGDKIIQIAAIVLENDQIVDKFVSFVNPLQKIPPFIEQLTGITNEMVDKAPTFEEIAEKIQSLLTNSTVVAHNVYFDLSFLQEELISCGLQFNGPILDTVELSRIAFPTKKSYKLSDLSDEFDMLHENPHRADSDAEVTAELFIQILEKFKSLPIITLQQLSRLSRSFISDLEDVLEDIIAEKLVNIEKQNHHHLEIIRTLAIKNRSQMVEANQDIDEQIGIEEIISHFKNSRDKFTKEHIMFRVRDEQLVMMKEIYDDFSSHQHSLIEAGTGSGKTLAYLVPSILYAKKQKRPIIVSTYTTTLQEQMLDHDVPFLEKVMPFSFNATILKGQSHYLCLQKFEQALKEPEDNYDFILTKSQILIWITETETGDVDELNLPSGGKALWSQLHVDHSSFNKNPFFAYCYYQHAKQKALKANLIITNHAMLISDIVYNQKLLPDYQEIIIDEAHHFHLVASEQLGVKFSYLEIHNLINRLGTSQTNGILQKFIKMNEINFSNQSPSPIFKIDQLVQELQDESHQFFSAIHAFVLSKTKDSSINRISYRIELEIGNNRTWNAILEMANRVSFLLTDIVKIMNNSLHVHMKELDLSIKNKIILEDYKAMILRISEYKDKLNAILFSQSDSTVSWIEIDSKGAKNAASIYSQPLNISEFLADHFFANKKSAILTSATLAVKHSFSYMTDAVGLTDFYPKQLQLKSPFNYKKQVKLFIPTDMPHVNEVSLDDFSEAIAANIGSVAQITDGKILALFTSYEMLKKTYQLLKEDETLEDFMILGQGTGSGSRLRLTKNFKQFDKAILLGTNSFWEGVDFPGEELTALMIVRLPFAPPDNPIVAAKSEQFKKQGKNAFYDYSLPEAILRFKQGFGRLIRSEDDRGILFVLDHRIVTTKYGKDFISSIPELEIEKKPMHLLTHSIEKWMNRD